MEQLRKSDLLEVQIYCAYAIDSCGGSASLDQIEYQIADKLPPLFSQDGNPWKGDKKEAIQQALQGYNSSTIFTNYLNNFTITKDGVKKVHDIANFEKSGT